MKKLFAFLFLLGAATLASSEELLVSGKPFTESGEMRQEKTVDGETTRIERGRIGSVEYVIHYSDGRAWFWPVTNPEENWRVECRKYGSINDVHCPIRKKGLSVYIYASGQDGVSIGPNIYPESSASITINAGKPLSTKPGKKGVFDDESGKAIIGQLNASAKVTLRYAQWPTKKPFDENISMQGYDEAVEYARWAMKHLHEKKQP